MKEITEKLNKIQTALVVPKAQFNKFGGYAYRSCEDILEALKPLLKETATSLFIKDEIVQVGDRYYVKATVVLSDGKDVLETSAFARESETRKGMDDSQITGATSSYARKSALNGLFCIDDTKDADTTNAHNDNREVISDKELNIIRDSLILLAASEDGFVKYLGVDKLENLLKKDYQKAITAIETKKKIKAQNANNKS